MLLFVIQLGAPPEISCLLDDIRQENYIRKRNTMASTCFGVDPELDVFMVRHDTSYFFFVTLTNTSIFSDRLFIFFFCHNIYFQHT